MNPSMKLASVALTLAVAFSPAAWSQENHQSSSSAEGANSSEQSGIYSYQKSPEHYYRLTFRVLQVSPNGKVVDSRSYSESIVSGPKSVFRSSIRTGDRVPFGVGNNFQYIDIGTNIDADKAEVVDHTLHLHVSARISSIPSKSPDTGHPPLTRQTSWDSYVAVPFDRPTIIFSSDNSADRGKMEMELTAVPIGQ